MLKREKLLFVLFLMTLLPLTSVVSAPFLGPVNPLTARDLPMRALGTYTEDFTTTTYEDSVPTTAAGWGSGAVTSPRIGAVTLLDHYTTTNPVRALDIQGRKVYLTTYHPSSPTDSIRILNITDPSDLTLMDDRTASPKFLSAKVAGDILYVGVQWDSGFAWSLAAYNVSNPYDIKFYNDYLSFDGNVTDLEVQGHFLYVARFGTGGNDFTIVDIEDPANLKIVGGAPYAYLLGLDVVGQLAYLANGWSGLHISNVSNPYAPAHVSICDTPGNATDVLIDGSLAYVADGSGGVQIIDVSNPSSPSLIGGYDTPGNAHRLALQGDTLYVADGSGGLVVLDVSDPTNPCLVDTYALTYAWDVDLYGGVVVVGADGGVYTFQIGSLDSLSYVGSYSGGYEFWDVRVRGDIAYIAAGPDGFLTVDVSNPHNPVFLDNYSAPAGHLFRKLDISGHIAYVIDYHTSGHTYSFDISNPSNIKLLDTDTAYLCHDIFVWGEIAFIAFEAGGFAAVNISNPYAMSFMYNEMAGTNTTAIWVQGYHLYTVENLGGMGTGFRIYDITDISNPYQVGSYAYTSYHYDVFVDGDIAYVADTDWVVILNVTDQYNPYYPPDGWTEDLVNATQGVWGFGPYIIDAHSTNGVNLIDASDINGPNILSNYPGATGALQVTVHGDYAYVANRTSLVILRLFKSAAATYSTGTFAAQSLNLQPSTFAYSNATLNVDDYKPGGTGVSYFLSADGGIHWEAVTPGTSHTFTDPGLDLRWKANFTNTYSDRSVHIYEVSVAYDVYPPAASPLPTIIAVIVIIVVILVILLLYFLWYKKKEK